MKKQIFLITVVLVLAFSLCAPASATIIDDVFSFFNGNEKVSVDLITVENSIVKNIIESSTSTDDAVNKIVINCELNSMAKLNAQTIVFGFNESWMTALNETPITPLSNETSEMTQQSILQAQEAQDAYSAYMVTFATHYKPTGKFGDPIN
ncbi:MAG: hypothetical protein M0R51_15595 [Clostridia bacterium]|jgi:hypothetical protein|nr:hypothetical protein [Clostridia bacterium]